MDTRAGTASDDPELSARELEVMRLLSTGMSNGEIGAELYIGLETVKSHLSTIYRKIGVSSRGQAIAWMHARPALIVDPSLPLATVSMEHVPGGVRLVLAGEFDMTTTGLLSEALDAARQAGPGSVDLDMDAVTFIDSAALRALVGFRSQEPRVDARISNPSMAVRRVLEYAGLTAFFGIET